MNELDIYYRALINYRAETQQNHDCTVLRNHIAQAGAEQDRVIVIRNICTVEEDWIQAIEEGLVFVDKAIQENRQFIYSNGEVREIEKVKHISRESVQHLAKHSNLITREPKGDDIIPDKLYSVERLNDMAVYENRFLYMLLCYLRDFVTLRHNKILELSNKYDGSLQFNKHITMPKREMTLKVELHDEKRDDSYLREHNAAKSAIDRMDAVLKDIQHLITTPLMEETSKSPMLRPPITKTNVLKMDNNFKGAVALYDFILAYDKPGYRVDTKRIELSPFASALAEDMSEAAALMSFVTYAHGLDLLPMLKQNHQAEEAHRHQLQLEKHQQAIAEMKRRIAAKQESPEEYILEQERQIKLLQSENRKIGPLHQQLQQMGISSRQLTAAYDAAKLENQAVRQELDNIEAQHQAQMDEVKDAYNERIHQMLLQHERQLKELELDFQSRIAEVNAKMQAAVDTLESEIQGLNSQLTESQSTVDSLTQNYQSLQEEKQFLEARVRAVRAAYGETMEEDFTEEVNFDQLEKEYKAFTAFYKNNWRKTKKSIRSQLLNYQYLKGKSEQ